MRPRERYALWGPAQTGDVELVALLLGTGAGGLSSGEIATAVLERFGGAAGIAQSEVAELQQVAGVGLARAVRLHAAVELGRRSVTRPDPGEPVDSPERAFALLGPGLRGLAHEELHALYLDRRWRPLALRPLTRGSDAFTVVDPRQIFRTAVRLGAHALVLAHNHPSGDPEPSSQDAEVTRRVAAAGRVLGIQLADHLVVGGEGFTSFAERGALPTWSSQPTGWVNER